MRTSKTVTLGSSAGIVGTRSARLSAAVAAAAVGLSTLISSTAARASVELDVPNGTTNLTTLGATSTSDLTFTNTAYSPAAFTVPSNLAIATLNDNSPTALSVSNAGGSAASTLTLAGGTNSVAPAAGDLLYVGPTGSLTLTGGTGNAALGLVLASSGNFDVAGSAAISSVISDGGAGSAVNSTGAGTLTLSGVNTFGGGLTVSAGRVSIAANTALGGTNGTTGAVTLNGGTLATTAGITNTHAITIGAAGGTIDVTTTGQYFFNTANTLLGSGTLTLAGNGTLTQNTGNLRVAQANTYNGNVVLQGGGTFEYGVANAVASGAAFTLNNQGELAVNNGVTTSNGITVNGGVNSVLSFENGTTGTFAGPITLNADLTVGLRDWYNYGTVRSGTISGIISGSGGVFVNSGNGGGGTLTLSNTNSFTGATTLNKANLTLGGFQGSVASSDVSVTSGTLAINSGSGTAASSVTRGKSVTLTAGTLTDTGTTSTTSDVITGALNIGSGLSAITLTPNASGQAALTFDSIGTRAAGSLVNLTGTFGGSPGVNNFNLLFATAPSGSNFIGGGGALGSSTSSVIPWIRNNSGNFSTYDATRGVTALTGQVSSITSGATANVALTSTPTLAADTTVNSLELNGNSIVMAAHTLTVTSGAIDQGVNGTIGSDASASNYGTLAFGTTEGIVSVRQARTLTINSAITGSGGLTFVGYYVNNGSAGKLILNGANTFTGVTNLYGSGNTSNLYLTNSLALQNSTLNYVAGNAAVLNFGNGGTSGQTAYTFGGLSGSANIALQNNNTTAAGVSLTVGSAGDGDSTTYSGVLSGTLAGNGLIKAGGGSLTLTGANTFNGGTQVTGGTLVASNASALGAGAVTVNGGTLSPFGAGVGTVSLGSGATLTMTAGTLAETIASASSFDKILGSGAGTFTITGGTLDLSSSTGIDYTQTYPILSGFAGGAVSGLAITGYDTTDYTASLSNGGVLSFAATIVPEPASAALIAVGGLGLVARRRRHG